MLRPVLREMSPTPQANRSGVTLVRLLILTPPMVQCDSKCSYGALYVNQCVQHMTVKKKRQASRLHATSIELMGYISLANALPGPERLPGAEPKGTPSVREHWDSDEADVKALIRRFPRFRSFMAGVNVSEEIPVQMVQRCLQLKTIRSILYTIARLHSNNPLTTTSVPVAPYLENLVSVKTDAGGNLRVEHDPLLQALDGVEVRRIRECPICGELYWARRIDKPTCKAKCAHVLRERRYRKNYLEKYKLQRDSKTEDKHRPEDTAAQSERERKELESLPEYNSARRSARPPIGPK